MSADEKSLKTEEFKKTFLTAYDTALITINSMNKRMQIAYNVKEVMDKTHTDIKQEVKDEVWNEFAIRLALEKNKVMDKIFTDNISKILVGVDGKIDYTLSIFYKQLFMMSMRSSQPSVNPQNMDEMAMSMAWRPILEGVKKNELDFADAYRALDMVANQFSMTGQKKKELFDGFVKFAKKEGIDIPTMDEIEKPEKVVTEVVNNGKSETS